MKKSILNLVLPITFFAALLFIGCQSPAQKVDNAESNLNDANQNLKDAKADEVVANKKAVAAEEWTAFRAETEIKIKDNEARITELRAKKKATGKTLDAAYTQRIDTLEQKNLGMRTMMDDYESTKISSDWEEFKREFNHDMEELGMALKNLTVSNKK
jgi:uncharacterized protein YicC (UPF0701 family)